jgi:hypothetical protein
MGEDILVDRSVVEQLPERQDLVQFPLLPPSLLNVDDNELCPCLLSIDPLKRLVLLEPGTAWNEEIGELNHLRDEFHSSRIC